MSQKIEPKEIYKLYKRGKIDKDTALEELFTLIEFGKDINFRFKCLELLGKFKPLSEETFKILENLLISDQSSLIRAAAVKLIIQNFLNEGFIPLKWVIQKDKSNLVLRIIIEELESNFEENSILLKQELLQRFSRIFHVVPEEAKFFMDLFVYLANLGENMDINTNYVYKYKFEEFWPYPFKGAHYEPKILAVKNSHAIALILYSNKGSVIPESIGFLKDLKYLRLSYNSLKNLPRTIRNLKNLKYLNLYHNNFKKVPSSIFFLKSLRMLMLEENNLNSLPHWIGSLNRLRHLDLLNNNLKLIPKSLFELAKRKQARKYIFNGVNEDEAPVLGLLELLSGIRLKKLEKDEDIYHSVEFNPFHFMYHYRINEMGHITSIYFYFREPYLGVFPQQICSLKYLEELHLENHSIKYIPDCIGNLTSLKVLDLMDNEIESLPESIKKLRNLERVSFYANPIKEIPEFLRSKKGL
ncbi:MAG: hypothetical protein ACFE9T_10140 [Promethearchaeota archaeon]